MKTPHLRALTGAWLATLLLSGCVTTPAPKPVATIATPTLVTPAPADAQRAIAMQGALNVRSFENLRGKRGAIPASAFVRAADLHRLTPADLDVLAANEVVLDLDLRTAEEAGTSPDALATDARFRYARISLLGVEKIDMSSLPDSLGAMYVQSLATNQSQFRQVFETIAAQKKGTVLFHCTAGKDRTGMIAATLLSLAGVSRREIVHDYAVSAHYLAPMMGGSAQMTEIGRTNPKLAALMGSPPEAIEAFLEALDARHGGARAYLKTIGVSDADVNALLTRLGQG